MPILYFIVGNKRYFKIFLEKVLTLHKKYGSISSSASGTNICLGKYFGYRFMTGFIIKASLKPKIGFVVSFLFLRKTLKGGKNE